MTPTQNLLGASASCWSRIRGTLCGQILPNTKARSFARLRLHRALTRASPYFVMVFRYGPAKKRQRHTVCLSLNQNPAGRGFWGFLVKSRRLNASRITQTIGGSAGSVAGSDLVWVHLRASAYASGRLPTLLFPRPAGCVSFPVIRRQLNKTCKNQGGSRPMALTLDWE